MSDTVGKSRDYSHADSAWHVETRLLRIHTECNICRLLWPSFTPPKPPVLLGEIMEVYNKTVRLIHTSDLQLRHMFLEYYAHRWDRTMNKLTGKL